MKKINLVRILIAFALTVTTMLTSNYEARGVDDDNLAHKVDQTSCMQNGVEVAISNNCITGSGSCRDNTCPYGTSEQ